MAQLNLPVETEWERRKLYLLQSFLGYRDDLSPVPEEHVVDTASGFPEGIPSDDSSGSWSSLPSLIIEREPRRNKHDDPEEFYEDLFRRMKKLYDHLFIRHRNFSSFDELLSEIEFGSASPQSPREEFFLEHHEAIRSSANQEDLTGEGVAQAKESPSKKIDGSEGGTEDTLLLPESEESFRGFSVSEMEVMRAAHQGVNPEAQFSPQHTIASEATPQLSLERASIRRERATTSCTSLEVKVSEGDLADIPTCSSTPKAVKRKTTESGRESRQKKKKSEIWEDVFKNFFVGRPRVFRLVERLPDNYQTTSSTEP